MSTRPTIVPKGRFQQKYRGNSCLNCEHPLALSDRYCPNCSQVNSTKKIALKDFFSEFFSSLLSYDSKLIKTLSTLLLRPGTITKDYISGKRASYTNPFRFLLSLAISYFLMLGFSGNLSDLDHFGEDGDTGFNMTGPFSFAIDSLEVNEIKEGLEKNGDTLPLGNWNVEALIHKNDSIVLSDPKKHFQTFSDKPLWDRLNGKAKFFNTLLRKDKVYRFSDVVKKYGIPATFENERVFNATRSALKVSKRPGTFASALISKLPFFIFFFLPVFALFIWILYVRKKHTYTDHLIFSFHNQSLLFILLTISFLLDSLINKTTNGIFLLIFGFYLYKAMRNFYQQGRVKTILKYVVLNVIFVILVVISATVFLTGSMMTF